MSASDGRSPPDSSASSILYGDGCVAPAVACPTSVVKPTGLTVCLPNARASGASTSNPGWAIADLEAPSPPPPRNAGLYHCWRVYRDLTHASHLAGRITHSSREAE